MLVVMLQELSTLSSTTNYIFLKSVMHVTVVLVDIHVCQSLCRSSVQVSMLCY